MNHKLLDAIGQIDDGYIESAQKRLDGANTVKRHRGSFRKLFLPLAAAALLLISTFTVAMAASPAFRAAVLTFFRITEVEKAPEPGTETSGGPSVTEKVIGELIKARYIQMDGRSQFRYTGNNLLYQYEFDEELQDMRPARFWTVEDGQLVPVEVAMNRREIAVDWNGAAYRGVFDWLEWNGSIEVFHTSLTGAWGENDLEVNTHVSAIPGRTDKVLLTLILDTQMHSSSYYMLYDLASGQVEDFLAGTGAENLDRDTYRLHDALWASDMSGAILTCGWWGEDTDYYLDLKAGTLTGIGALTGVNGAAAVFADDRTLLLYQWDEPEVQPGPAVLTCWSYSLDAGVLTKTLDHVPLYDDFEEQPHGVFLLGDHSPYSMVVDGDGRARLVDLVTGAVTAVENFVFSPHASVGANRSGTKLLYYVRDMDAIPLQWSQLGVIDMEQGTFIAFDRETAANVWESLFWLDDNRIAIENTAAGDVAVRGLYLYEF